jgi:DNA-binding response OmpR family regulator
MPDRIPHILVVDDEDSIRYFLERFLTREGLRVTAAASGEAALAAFESEEFDLALLDLKMKGIHGLEVLAAAHTRWPATIIIVLTAHASLESAVEALRRGAHDYLFKPCKTVDLRESIRTGLLKRQQLMQLDHMQAWSTARPAASTTAALLPDETAAEKAPLFGRLDVSTRFLQYGGLIVDSIRHIITVDGILLELSPTEFDLLAYLVSEAPRVVPSQELIREVQGYDSSPAEAAETIRSHMYHIRQKIKTASARSVLRTVRGVGYTIAD